MADVGIKELLEAGVHFGHQTRRWNPKMRRFIHGERGGIYIIDLLKTQELLHNAQEFASALSHRGGTVLFVGTKKQARDAIKEAAEARHALRQPPLARRAADELPDDQPADQAPARPRALRDGGPAGAAADPRAPVCRGRPGEAAREPRRREEHAAPAGRDLHHRPQDRGDRRARGPAPAHPDHRPGRHELRPGRHRVRHPGQRRRHPLVRGHRACDRRRREGGADASSARRRTAPAARPRSGPAPRPRSARSARPRSRPSARPRRPSARQR